MLATPLLGKPSFTYSSSLFHPHVIGGDTPVASPLHIESFKTTFNASRDFSIFLRSVAVMTSIRVYKTRSILVCSKGNRLSRAPSDRSPTHGDATPPPHSSSRCLLQKKGRRRPTRQTVWASQGAFPRTDCSLPGIGANLLFQTFSETFGFRIFCCVPYLGFPSIWRHILGG